MILQLSKQPLSSKATGGTASSVPTPLSLNGWIVYIYHKSGGLKKVIYINQDNSPLNSFSFEYNERIMGAGTLNFSYLDFPLDADDFVLIRYNNNLVYRAIIETIADPKGGKVKMIFVELKSSNIAKEVLIEKFRATECFMDYCESISKRFFSRSILRRCEKRFVVFYSVPTLAKTPTRSELSTHNKPENAKFIANPRRTKLRQLL